MPERDYDTTMARIAGNIAAGLVSQSAQFIDQEIFQETAARVAVTIATRIVTICRERREKQLASGAE